MTDFGSRVRVALDEQGISLRRAAKETHYNPGYLSRVLSGQQRPSAPLAEALDALVGANGEIAALAEQQPRIPVPSLSLPSLAPDAELYERLVTVAENPSRVDVRAVEWLERCLAEHRRAEDELGSGPVIDVVRQQMRTVSELGREARSDQLRDRLVSLTAQYGQFMAWLCNDQGDKAAALAWYDRAHGWATEAGDANMAATTLSMKAHIAWSIGDGARCIRLGEAARWNDGHTSLGVVGMAAQMSARGHALVAAPDAAHRELDTAEAMIRDAAQSPDEEPDWLYFYGDTWFLAQRGMVELELGNGPTSVDMLSRALDGLPEHYRRDRAWYRACLAKAHALTGDLDAAAGHTSAATRDALDVNAYAVDELQSVARTVSRRAPRIGRELAENLRQGWTGHAKRQVRSCAALLNCERQRASAPGGTKARTDAGCVGVDSAKQTSLWRFGSAPEGYPA